MVVLLPHGWNQVHVVGVALFLGCDNLVLMYKAAPLIPHLNRGQGEQYQLIWSERAEFVRTAVRHGATIIPFAAVGGDDIVEVSLQGCGKIYSHTSNVIFMCCNRPHVRSADLCKLTVDICQAVL